MIARASTLVGLMAVGFTVVGLAACQSSGSDSAGVVAGVTAPTAPVTAAVAPGPALAGPMLDPQGHCLGEATGTATAIAAGIGECELVRLKGRTPTDVLVGESGRGQREVQVLYAEPTGRELYFFVDNRLDRIVR